MHFLDLSLFDGFIHDLNGDGLGLIQHLSYHFSPSNLITALHFMYMYMQVESLLTKWSSFLKTLLR